jgi:hypothetical protein
MRPKLLHLFTLFLISISSTLLAQQNTTPIATSKVESQNKSTKDLALDISKERLKKPTVVSDGDYRELFTPLEKSVFFTADSACPIEKLEANTWLITSPKHFFMQKASIYLGDLKKSRGLALYRLSSLNNKYMWPLFWEEDQDIPENTLLILWQEAPSTYGAIVPVLGEKTLVELRSEGHKLFADMDTGVQSALEQNIPLAVAGFDSNPYRLIKRLVAQAKHHSPFPPKTINKAPKWVKSLGWSSEKVLQNPLKNQDFLNLLMEIEKEKLSFGFLLLDSPWQEINEKNQLDNFEFNSSLLMGLKPLVNEAKSRIGVKSVGVSHSIFGASHGVAPYSDLGREYQLLPKGLVHPDDYKRFISLLHAPLQEAGVDFLLLKDLSDVLDSVNSHLPKVEATKNITDAFKESYSKTFDTGLLSDQAHNSIHLYHSNTEDVVRTASPPLSGLQHNPNLGLYQSAYNSLLIGNLAIPDWGSFSSSKKDAWAQAAARVLSGGPIYINDDIEHINHDLLLASTLPNGEIFNWDHFAFPTRSSLFFDPIKDQPLMIFNTQGEVKTLGIFNLKDQDTGYLIGPQDVDLLPDQNQNMYVLFSYKEGYLGKVNVKDWIQRKIKAQDWDVVTFSPVKNGVAIIGNPQSLNPYGWVEKLEWKEKDNLSQLNICARAKGPMVIVTYKHPYAVYHKGIKLPFNWDGKVMEIETPRGEGKFELELFFFKKD